MKYLLELAFVFTAFVFFQCSVDQSIEQINEAEMELLEGFRRLESESQVKICGKEEPGHRLMLCLTFMSKESRKPLINQNIKFYHTSTTGEYEPTVSGDESTARLSGSAISNQYGQVFIETILPGNYSSSGDNRHIHTTVAGANPEAYDIHFCQYTGLMGRNFINGSDQHFLADLKFTKDSMLVSFLNIEVKTQ